MRRRRLIALAAAGLLVVTACGSAASDKASRRSSAQAASGENDVAVKTHTVRLPKSYKFEPSAIQVDVGDEVTWINEDDFPHTVRMLAEKGVNNKLGVGESISISFPRAGVFRYDCSLHPTQMKGQVVVKEPSR
jgi:plastocyanin